MAAGSRVLERLHFIIGMRDLVTERLGGVERRVRRFNQAMERGTNRIRTGAIAATAAVLGLVSALQPAIAQERALREVATLGIEETTLGRLSDESLRLSSRFGTASTEVVSAAYDIQSAIAGLTGEELVSFTRAAAITAKGTRASTGQITDFFGTMFGIFQQQAEQVGKANWVDTLAGQTAAAVRQFKTTGPQLAAAFSQLGADATALGLTMREQFAVLGNLQATLPGPQAATAFRGFLRGVGRAEAELGVTLTDTQGRLLSIPDVLERLQGRLAGLGRVERAQVIQKAFGSEEAVRFINLLIARSGKLREDIVSIGEAGGLEAAEEMARRGTTSFDRLWGSVRATAIAFQMRLLKVLNPWFDTMSAGLLVVQGWIERWPNLVKLLGSGVVLLTAFVAALGLLGVMAGVFTILKGGFGLVTGAVKALGKAMLFLLFNPWGLLIAGIIGGIILAVVYWDEITAAFGKGIDLLVSWWDELTAAVGRFWEAVLDSNVVRGFMHLVELVTGFFGGEGGEEAALATMGIQTEQPEGSAREALQQAVSGGGGGRTTIINVKTEKTDTAQIRRFMALEGNG